MRVSAILNAARARGAAQGPLIKLRLLQADEIEELSAATLNWLRNCPGKASPVAHATEVALSRAGVLPMWGDNGNLLESVHTCLRLLRISPSKQALHNHDVATAIVAARTYDYRVELP